MNGLMQILRTRVFPLAWVPVFWVLACRWQVTKGLGVSASVLALPLAGYLGRRFGRLGVLLTGVGGLPLLITAGSGPFQVGGRMDIYVLGLIVSAIAAKGEHWRDWIPQLGSPRLLFAAVVLLPCVVSWHGPLTDDFNLTIRADLILLYSLLLFLAGFRRIPSWPLFGVVIGAQATGLVLEALVRIAQLNAAPPVTSHAGLVTSFPAPAWGLFYYADYPAALMGAVLCYAVGRNFERMRFTGRPGIGPWWKAAGAVVLVALLAAGSGLDRALFPPEILNIWKQPQHLHLFGSAVLLPWAALAGGLWLRRTGVALVAVFVAAFWVLEYTFTPGLGFEWRGAYSVEVEELVTVLVFGWVGRQLRIEALGEEGRSTVARWVVFALVTLATLRDWLLPEEPESFADLWPLLGAFAGIMLGVAAIAWWRRRRGSPPRSYDGWIALLALVPLVQTAVEETGAVWAKLARVSESGLGPALQSGRLSPLLLALAVYGWVLVTAVRTVLRDAGAWGGDVLRVLHALARLLGLNALVARINRIMPARGTSGDAPVSGWRATLIRYLRVGQWLLVAVAVFSLAALVYAVLDDI